MLVYMFFIIIINIIICLGISLLICTPEFHIVYFVTFIFCFVFFLL